MQNTKKLSDCVVKNIQDSACISERFAVYYLCNKRERRMIRKMTDNWIMGDLDDMIFADCDWQPSER